MRTLQPTASACRHCGCYVPEGRRGGYCQQLSVPVQGAWKSCPLAIPAFAPSWENPAALDLDSVWESKVLQLPITLPKEAVLTYASVEAVDFVSNDVA